MSVKHIGLVLDNLDAPPAVKLIAIILADHADGEGLCWPSYRKIAERSGMSERMVRRHIKTLIELAVITKLRTGNIVHSNGKTLRLSNAYRVNAHILQARKKLSTKALLVTDANDHLEVDKSDRSRWSPMTTKPSVNHQLNHKQVENVDNSREPVSIDDLFAQMIQEPDDD